jgi:hypothetical protein
MSYWKFCHQCGSQVDDQSNSQCRSCKAHLHCDHCQSPIFPAALACGGCGQTLPGASKKPLATSNTLSYASPSYSGTGYSSSSYSSVGSYASSSSASSSYKPPAYASSISASTPQVSKSPPSAGKTMPLAAQAEETPASGSGYHGSGYGGSGFGGSKVAPSYASPVIATGAVLGGVTSMGSFKSTFPVVGESSPTAGAAATSNAAESSSNPAFSLEESIDAILGTDASMRSAALAELKKRPQEIKELVAALEKPARIDRLRPARVLLQLEHEPIKAAATISDALCNDPSWSTRKAALDALVSEGQKAKDAIPSLSKALADGRVDRKEISCMAAEAIGAISPKAQAHAAKALEKALSSDNWFLREAAKKALEKIKK